MALEWIINNKEWLFSGIGISIISILFLTFKKKSSQTIKYGKDSTNIQADKVTINNNVDFALVKDITMDVFKANFYDLGEKLEKNINERAEKIIIDYLTELSKNEVNVLDKTFDIDIRYSVFEAQKSYARLGDDEIAKLLVEALVERTLSQNHTFIKLVLKESLEIIPKLTSKQIDILSLIFLTRHATPRPLDEFHRIVIPYFNEIDNSFNSGSFQHLQYAGALSISIGSITFDRVLSELIKEDSSSISEVSLKFPEISLLQEVWDSTRLKNCTLTTVGICIAIINLRVKMNYEVKIEEWINEE